MVLGTLFFGFDLDTVSFLALFEDDDDDEADVEPELVPEAAAMITIREQRSSVKLRTFSSESIFTIVSVSCGSMFMYDASIC